MNENIFNNVFINEYQEIPFIEQFKNHVPNWGAKIVYNGISNIILSNTCSIEVTNFRFNSEFERYCKIN
ncbi:hypothetical protein BpHYR1_035088 [Brachionus plicatilis]|uniref:Uncharacterized protein n=1 Tax=Brachionus plicatilis TaxID=10195 RepID=A0A3M7SZB2_BRAPC|nr:hypothetical protein BpHYR1_035088 [Brachionus plicatilis]